MARGCATRAPRSPTKLRLVRGRALDNTGDADYYVVVKIAGRVVLNSAESIGVKAGRPESGVGPSVHRAVAPGPERRGGGMGPEPLAV